LQLDQFVSRLPAEQLDSSRLDALHDQVSELVASVRECTAELQRLGEQLAAEASRRAAVTDPPAFDPDALAARVIAEVRRQADALRGELATERQTLAALQRDIAGLQAPPPEPRRRQPAAKKSGEAPPAAGRRTRKTPPAKEAPPRPDGA
jgi:hypothetical protein